MALITCFALDNDNDLLIEKGAAMLAEDTQAIKTMLNCRLNAIKGNWFLNLLDGVDYFGSVFGKKSADIELESEFKIAINGTIGVTELSDFEAVIGTNRQLSVNFTALTIFSQPITQTVPISVA